MIDQNDDAKWHATVGGYAFATTKTERSHASGENDVVKEIGRHRAAQLIVNYPKDSSSCEVGVAAHNSGADVHSVFVFTRPLTSQNIARIAASTLS